MKFGSVKFFKRLILAVVAALIVVPLVLVFVFAALWQGEKRRADGLAAQMLVAQPVLAAEGEIFPDAPVAVAVEPQEMASAVASAAGEVHGYQQMYPTLYAETPKASAPKSGVCYLTFDDGPSSNTQAVLDILDRYNIKATFFVTGEGSVANEDALRAAAKAGHTIGVHSYTHKYTEVYASVENYLADFERMYDRIVEVTGEAPTIFRFPGGSVNNFNISVYPDIIAEMTRRGFVYFDWNAAGSDAVAGGASAAAITGNVLRTAAGWQRTVVLLHDRDDNGTTVQALPGIIEGLEEQGYRFEPLTNKVAPVTYFSLE